MTVGKICSREVDTACPEESVFTIARRMHARKVGTLVVINANRDPIGMVTDRDLSMRVIAAGGDPTRMTVREVMTPRPATVHVDTDIHDTIGVMRTNRCRRIAVVDCLGHLVGLLSLDDILTRISQEFQLIGELIREESPQSLAETR